MTDLDMSTIEALNALLEDERASVEMEIAFANGATERNEREAFVAMGSEEVGACCTLRELLAAQDAEVSRRINGIVLRVLAVDRYDDRLRAFAEHQLGVCESIQQLLDATRNNETRRLLEDIYQLHARFGHWCERRAEEFANSRLLDFRMGRIDGVGPAASRPNEPDPESAVPGETQANREARGTETGEAADAPDQSPKSRNGHGARFPHSQPSVDVELD